MTKQEFNTQKFNAHNKVIYEGGEYFISGVDWGKELIAVKKTQKGKDYVWVLWVPYELCEIKKNL